MVKRRKLIDDNLDETQSKSKIEKMFSDYKVTNFSLVTDARSIDHLVSAKGWGINIADKNLACFEIELEDEDVEICREASFKIKEIFDEWFQNKSAPPKKERPYDADKWTRFNVPFFSYNRGTSGVYCSQTADPEIFKMLYRGFGFDKAAEAVDRVFEKYNPIQA